MRFAFDTIKYRRQLFFIYLCKKLVDIATGVFDGSIWLYTSVVLVVVLLRLVVNAMNTRLESLTNSKMNFIKADIVVSTTPSLDVFQWKRSKGAKYYVHLPHMPNDITTYKMFGLDFYDAVLVSGEYQKEQIRRLESLRSIPEKEVVLAGIPYLDAMKKRLDASASFSDAKKEKTILLAPSWGNNGILTAYDGKSFIESLIKTGYKVIIRPHPQSFTSEKELIEGLMKQFPESDDVSAIMPWTAAIILVILSIFLTFIGGLIPSKSASRQDPVTALRTE